VLQFKGLSPAAMTSTAPVGGGLATVPGGTSPGPGAAAVAPGSAPPPSVVRIPAGESDACAGKQRCYDAGPFVAEHSMTFPSFGLGAGAGAPTAAAPTSGTTGGQTAEEIKKAGEAIRNIIRGRGQK
jgi:hypothetical protein